MEFDHAERVRIIAALRAVASASPDADSAERQALWDLANRFIVGE